MMLLFYILVFYILNESANEKGGIGNTGIGNSHMHKDTLTVFESSYQLLD
jgi:hypothetical protein